MICVVIPLHNEIEIVSALEKAVRSFCELNKDLAFIMVCDHCDDGTRELLESSFDDHARVTVLDNRNIGGYGSALRSGFTLAHQLGFEWAIAIDSDLTNPLSEVKKLSDWIKSKSKDSLIDVVIVKGNRFSGLMPSFNSVPIHRLVLSTLANRISRILVLGASRDPTNGFRAVRLEWINSNKFNETGFQSIMEEVYFALKDKKLIVDFKTELRFDQALRHESSFTLDRKTASGYLKYSFLTLKSKIF